MAFSVQPERPGLTIEEVVSTIVDSAPGTLDTLNELAAALNDNASFANTVLSSLSSKVSSTTFTSFQNSVNSSLAGKASTADLAGKASTADLAAKASTADLAAKASTADLELLESKTLDSLNRRFLVSNQNDTYPLGIYMDPENLPNWGQYNKVVFFPADAYSLPGNLNLVFPEYDVTDSDQRRLEVDLYFQNTSTHLVYPVKWFRNYPGYGDYTSYEILDTAPTQWGSEIFWSGVDKDIHLYNTIEHYKITINVQSSYYGVADIQIHKEIYAHPGSNFNSLVKGNLTNTAASGTHNVSVEKDFNYITADATGNFGLNFISSGNVATVPSIMSEGTSYTTKVMVKNGSTAYYPNSFSISGTSATVKWLNGSAPSSGNSNSVDMYEFTFVKKTDGSVEVFGKSSRFA